MNLFPLKPNDREKLTTKYAQKSLLVQDLKDEVEDSLVYLNLEVWPRCLNYALKNGIDKAMAREIYWIAFEKFWHEVKADKFNIIEEKPNSVENYLFIKFSNHLRDFRKEKQRHIELNKHYSKLNNSRNSNNFDIQSKLEYDEIERKIWDIINTFPPKCVAIFNALLKEGLSLREVFEKQVIPSKSYDSVKNRK